MDFGGVREFKVVLLIYDREFDVYLSRRQEGELRKAYFLSDKCHWKKFSLR